MLVFSGSSYQQKLMTKFQVITLYNYSLNILHILVIKYQIQTQVCHFKSSKVCKIQPSHLFLKIKNSFKPALYLNKTKLNPAKTLFQHYQVHYKVTTRVHLLAWLCVVLLPPGHHPQHWPGHQGGHLQHTVEDRGTGGQEFRGTWGQEDRRPGGQIRIR